MTLTIRRHDWFDRTVNTDRDNVGNPLELPASTRFPQVLRKSIFREIASVRGARCREGRGAKRATQTRMFDCPSSLRNHPGTIACNRCGMQAPLFSARVAFITPHEKRWLRPGPSLVVKRPRSARVIPMARLDRLSLTVLDFQPAHASQ